MKIFLLFFVIFVQTSFAEMIYDNDLTNNICSINIKQNNIYFNPPPYFSNKDFSFIYKQKLYISNDEISDNCTIKSIKENDNSLLITIKKDKKDNIEYIISIDKPYNKYINTTIKKSIINFCIIIYILFIINEIIMLLISKSSIPPLFSFLFYFIFLMFSNQTLFFVNAFYDILFVFLSSFLLYYLLLFRKLIYQKIYNKI